MSNEHLHHRIYTKQELEECSEGHCCQCGVCCTVYGTVLVPSELGNPHSVKMVMQAGTRCPQLIEDMRGKMLCAIHASPERSDICGAWLGNHERGDGNTNAEHLLELTARFIAFPQSTEQHRNALELFRRGVIRDSSITQAQRYCSTHTKQSVQCFCRFCESVPTDLFESLKIRESIKRSGIRSSDIDPVPTSSIQIPLREYFFSSDVL